MNGLNECVEIGERYMINWRNGQKQAGDIIDRRALKKVKIDFNGSSSSSGSSSNELVAADYEYYVHFPNFDRRMDEWVMLDKVDLVTGVVGISSELDEHGTKKRSHSKIRPYEAPLEESKENTLISLEKEHDEITKVKNIHSIVLGKFEIETWYYAPYPDDYCCDDKMFICEFCLKYMKKHSTLWKHSEICKMKSPPGNTLMYM